jgi:phenylacetate-CoA ligase
MLNSRLFSENYYKDCLDTLELALHKVPAYTKWTKFDPGPSYSIDERYEALPILSKKEFKKAPASDFVPLGSNITGAIKNGEIETLTTMGLLGETTRIFWHQNWWDNTEKASWNLNINTSLSKLGNHREGVLTSAQCVGILSDEFDLPLEKRLNGRFLYLNEKSSPLLWQKHHFERILYELRTYKPIILEANPTFLSVLARYAIDKNKEVFQPRLLVLTYELLSQIDFRYICRVFECPIIDSYGCTEAGHIFLKCEYGKYHQNDSWCRVDFEPFEKNNQPSEFFRIIVTSFNNPWRVLLRYDTGDLCRLDSQSNCLCGRNNGFFVQSLEGRSLNITRTFTNSVVTEKQVDTVLSDIESLISYQLIQITKEKFLFRYESITDSEKTKALIVEKIKSLYGNQIIVTFSKETLNPEKSGKFRKAYAEYDLGQDM